MRKITLFAMLLVGILAGRAQGAFVGTYEGSINLLHSDQSTEEMAEQTVSISMNDKEGVNITFPSFKLFMPDTFFDTQEVTIEGVTVTDNGDGSYKLAKETFTIQAGMIPCTASSLEGTLNADGSVKLIVSAVQNPQIGAYTTATFEGTKKFELVSVNPNATTPTTSVSVIQLVFSEEVTATIPEGGIEVVNNDTKEVIKIASVMENEWIEKTNVIFEFEKRIVTDKDGKEEEQAQYISAPGAYSYTIPAGCIKSVSGKEFLETSFTFSVVGTFEIENFTPAQTTSLEKIELTFDKEVTQVSLPASGMYLLDNYWSPVAKISNAVISEDKKTVTFELETPITTPGWYNLDINQGVITNADGINQYKSLAINVIDSAPSFDTNYKDGDKVEELGSAFEITFKNVTEVKLVQETLTVYLPGSGEAKGTATVTDNKIVVSFNQAFTTEGDYLFFIPAGMFTMDGVENEERQINVNLFKFQITPLEIVSVTPEVGKVDQIETIVITFNQVVTPSYDADWQMISRELSLTCGDQTYTLTYAPEGWSATNQLRYIPNAVWKDTDYESTPITADGTYVLNLADIVVDHNGEEGFDDWGYATIVWHSKNVACQGTYTWTIGEGDNAVDFVGAEAGEQVIYDLLGRRVEKITTAGIYIVNGRKMIIK